MDIDAALYVAEYFLIPEVDAPPHSNSPESQNKNLMTHDNHLTNKNGVMAGNEGTVGMISRTAISLH